MARQTAASEAVVRHAVGPLGLAVEAIDAVKAGDGVEAAEESLKPRHGRAFATGANPLVLLRRTAFVTPADDLDKVGAAATLAWATRSGLGQDPAHLAHVCARRARALERLAQDQGEYVERLIAEPEWRLAVGIGDRANAYEFGLSLHGTHGWPIIPGSGLKGLALSHARGNDPALLRAVFGWPLPQLAPGGLDPTDGGVRFLDAIPDGEPVTVHRDVLTPHVKPYYDDAIKDAPANRRRPPSEQHKPEVIAFLSISGRFAVDLVGANPDHVRQAARWLTEAGDELGAGAKTAAGYGYLRLSRRPPSDGGPPS